MDQGKTMASEGMRPNGSSGGPTSHTAGLQRKDMAPLASSPASGYRDCSTKTHRRNEIEATEFHKLLLSE